MLLAINPREDLELFALVAPVLWAAYQYIIKPIFKSVQTTMKTLDSIAVLQTSISELQADMKPNGGSSMRDAIDRVEQLVLLNHNTLKAVLELMNSGFFLTDADGECTHVNNHWSSMTGMELSDALGHGWLTLLPIEDRQALWDEWALAVEDGRAFHRKVRMTHWKTHKPLEVYYHTIPLRNQQGEVVGHIGTLTEVT